MPDERELLAEFLEEAKRITRVSTEYQLCAPSSLVPQGSRAPLLAGARAITRPLSSDRSSSVRVVVKAGRSMPINSPFA